MLKFMTSRDLRNTPGAMWKALKADGTVAITANGVPRAIVIEVEEGDVELAAQVARRVKAQLAVSRMREDARRAGADRLDAEAVAREIRAARDRR